MDVKPKAGHPLHALDLAHHAHGEEAMILREQNQFGVGIGTVESGGGHPKRDLGLFRQRGQWSRVDADGHGIGTPLCAVPPGAERDRKCQQNGGGDRPWVVRRPAGHTQLRLTHGWWSSPTNTAPIRMISTVRPTIVADPASSPKRPLGVPERGRLADFPGGAPGWLAVAGEMLGAPPEGWTAGIDGRVPVPPPGAGCSGGSHRSSGGLNTSSGRSLAGGASEGTS